MKLIFLSLINFAIILTVLSSSEGDDENDVVINAMAKILDIDLDDDIPFDQIAPDVMKETTLPVTKEMMEIVQKLRDHFGSAWNEEKNE